MTIAMRTAAAAICFIVLVPQPAASQAAAPTPARQDAAPPTITASGHIARALALKRAGLEAAAIEQLKLALQEDPSVEVPDSLKPRLGYPTRPQHEWLIGTALPVAGTVVEFLLILVVAGLLIRRVKLWARPSAPTLHIQDFVTDGLAWSIGKTTRAMVEEAVRSPRTAKASEAHAITSGPIVPSVLPNDFGTAIPSAAPIMALLAPLIRWLLPVNQICINGTLHLSGRFGAGLTISVLRGQKVLSIVTMWEVEYGPVRKPTDAQSYFSLIEPASIWLRYELNGLNNPTGPALRELGTTNWRSYAAFRAGFRLHASHPAAAKEFYHRALLLDDANRGARTNLGVLLLPSTRPPASPPEDATSAAHAAHQAALQEWGGAALAQFERAQLETSDMEIDPSCVLASYMSANLLSVMDPARALERADALIAKLRKGLADKTAPSQMSEYLAGMYPIALVMWVGLLPPDRRAEAKAALAQIDIERPSSDLQYNLACLDSLWGNLETALKHLAFALELNPAHAKQARFDPSFDTLRNDPVFAVRFRELTQAAPGPPPDVTGELASLDIVGPAAARLRAANILSAADLVMKASTLSGLSQLAARLGIAESTVRRWAQVAELLRVGMEPAHVNVMARAGVDTIAAFAALTADATLRVFADFGSADAGFRMPTALELTVWRQTALSAPAMT